MGSLLDVLESLGNVYGICTYFDLRCILVSGSICVELRSILHAEESGEMNGIVVSARCKLSELERKRAHSFMLNHSLTHTFTHLSLSSLSYLNSCWMVLVINCSC